MPNCNRDVLYTQHISMARYHTGPRILFQTDHLGLDRLLLLLPQILIPFNINQDGLSKTLHGSQ